MSAWEYLSCAETAKLVRAALKREFPGVKFSVRSSTYAGGASIHISWTDGPPSKTVDDVAGQFAGADFDGMIDLKTHSEHWLYADGRVESFRSGIGHSYRSGTHTVDLFGEDVDHDEAHNYIAGVWAVFGGETSRQVDRDSDAFKAGQADGTMRKEQGARLVHFGADFIFTQRALSAGERDRLERAVAFLAGDDVSAFDGNRRYELPSIDGMPMCEYGSTLIHRLTHVSTEALEERLNEVSLSRPVSVSGSRRLCWTVAGGALSLAWRELKPLTA